MQKEESAEQAVKEVRLEQETRNYRNQELEQKAEERSEANIFFITIHNFSGLIGKK